jgi:hypothetical protein
MRLTDSRVGKGQSRGQRQEKEEGQEDRPSAQDRGKL